MRSNYIFGNSDNLLPWRQAQQTGKRACPHLGIGERIQNRFLLKSVSVHHDERYLHGQRRRRQPSWTTLAPKPLVSIPLWIGGRCRRPKNSNFSEISFSADT